MDHADASREGRASDTWRRWLMRLALLTCTGCADQTDAPALARSFTDVQVTDVRPSGDGVVVEYWVSDLSAPSLARALGRVRRYEVGGRRADAWKSNGLRVYQGPTADLIPAAAGITMTPQTRRETLPMLHRWTPIATGRRWDSGVDVWLDQQDWGEADEAGSVAVSMGRLSLGPGSLRLLARTWVAAGLTEFSRDGSGPGVPLVMVLEMAPQHFTGSAARTIDLAAVARPSQARDDGQFFERLRLELECEPGQTVLIVPAHPREEWPDGSPGGHGPGGLGAPRDGYSSEPEPQNSEPTVPDGPRVLREHVAGPRLPDLLTLGEAMLTDARVGQGASRRVILSVTPRLSEPAVTTDGTEPRDAIRRGMVR